MGFSTLTNFTDEELSYINFSVSSNLKDLVKTMDNWSMEDRNNYIVLSTLKAKVEAIQQVNRSIKNQLIQTNVQVAKLDQKDLSDRVIKTDSITVNENLVQTNIPNTSIVEEQKMPSYDDAVSDSGIKEKIIIKKK